MSAGPVPEGSAGPACFRPSRQRACNSAAAFAARPATARADARVAPRPTSVWLSHQRGNLRTTDGDLVAHRGFAAPLHHDDAKPIPGGKNVKSHSIRLIALLLALAPFAASQTGTTPAKPESKPQTTPATPAKPVTTPAATAESTPSVPVTGLTAENSAKVESALKAHTSTIYKCESCSKVALESGMCCEKPTKAVTGPALKSVKVDAATSTVSFTLAPGYAVRLTEIEKAIKPEGVTVQHDRLKLTNDTSITVVGVADQAAADELRKAINDAKLFEQIDIKTPAGKREASIVIKRAGTGATTEAKVKETLAKANPGFVVSDVVWMSPAQS